MSAIALWTDPGGMVTDVMLTEIELRRPLAPGAPLRAFMDPLSRPKLDRLLTLVTARGAASNWELNLETQRDEPLLVRAAAARTSDRTLMILSDGPADVQRLVQTLIGAYPEESEALRAAARRLAGCSEAALAGDETDTLADYARVNNQLIDAQRALAQQAVELERICRERSRFFEFMAHDLRNPLMCITGYASLLRGGASGTLTPDQDRMVEQMEQACATMADMLEELMQHARVQAGALELHPSRVEPAPLAHAVVTAHTPHASKKGIELRLELGPSTPTEIQADAAKLEQVLTNLLSNAIKFSPSGKTVTLRTGAHGERLRVEVEDQGPGISPEDQLHLFEPFHRAGPRPTAGEPSTGLGLAITKSIVEAHGGAIVLRSTVGQGSVFTVELPQAG